MARGQDTTIPIRVDKKMFEDLDAAIHERALPPGMRASKSNVANIAIKAALEKSGRAKKQPEIER